MNKISFTNASRDAQAYFNSTVDEWAMGNLDLSNLNLSSDIRVASETSTNALPNTGQERSR